MSLDELYQEVILDHYKNPRGKEAVSCPDATCSLKNPLCGDQICLAVDFDACPHKGTCVAAISSSGHGCSISQASASMLCDLCKGKTVDEIEQLCHCFRGMMRGDVPEEQLESLGDAQALQGVRRFSARVKCAMLAWEAVERCLQEAKALPSMEELPTDNKP
jgi:nitrogen fixation NifU-like protein